MVTRNSTPDADAPALPEVLRSIHLARILTPIIDEMVTEAAARFEAQSLGRYMAEPLNAVRALAREIRRYHGLAAILPSDNGQINREAFLTEHGHYPDASAEPEPAEATS